MVTLTNTQVQSSFNFVGNLIKLGNVGLDQGQVYRTGLMTLTDLAAVEGPTGYDLFNAVITPLASSLKTTISTVEKTPVTMLKQINSYYTGIYNVTMGVDGSSTSEVLDALRAVMLANGQYLNPAGAYMPFFIASLGYTNMPTTGTTVITEIT